MMKENEVRFTVDIPKELHKKLKIKAAEEGISIKELVIRFIDIELEKLK